MDVADVERMLDDRMFSGPAQLGPIADAIRGKAKEYRDAVICRSNESRTRHRFFRKRKDVEARHPALERLGFDGAGTRAYDGGRGATAGPGPTREVTPVPAVSGTTRKGRILRGRD